MTSEKRRLTLHMVAHSHIDVAFHWRTNETAEFCIPETFTNAADVIERTGAVFAQSQLWFYDVMRERYPDLFKTVKRLIAEGTWHVVGGSWCEMDEMLPSGESLIRQFLQGALFCRRYLEIDQPLAWAPDAFTGHGVSIPKIYSGCGIRYYLSTRHPPAGTPVIRWESPDGSSILACFGPGGYEHQFEEHMVTYADEFAQQTGCDDVLMLWGRGDHGGGIRMSDLEPLETLCRNPEFPVVKHTPPLEYFGMIEKRGEWPVQKGEFSIDGEQAWWNGCYTSQAKVKQRVREAESLLLIAERFASLGVWASTYPLYPVVDFNNAWRKLLLNQFHDTLPGSVVHDAADDALRDCDAVEAEARRLLAFGLGHIGAHIDTRGEGYPVVVYNPVCAQRSEIVEFDVELPVPATGALGVVDHEARALPCVVSATSKGAHVCALVRDVPSIGYTVLRVVDAQAMASAPLVRAVDGMMENEALEVRWSAEGLTSVVDKRSGRQVLSGPGNTLALRVEEGVSTPYRLELNGSVEHLECLGGPVLSVTPLRASVQWVERSRNSLFVRRVVLRAGSDMVEFEMDVDWHEQNRLLTVEFPLSTAAAHAWYEQPYGFVERAQHPTFEYPAQNWVDLCTSDHGAALLTDSRHGFNVHDNVLRMSVIRSAHQLDPRMDHGKHSLRYALLPHEGDWRCAGLVQRGLAFCQPLIAYQEPVHEGTVARQGKVPHLGLGAQYSFFGTDCDHVLVTAVKWNQEQWVWPRGEMVVRLQETIGREADVTVTLPSVPRTVVETNHIEQTLAGAGAVAIDGRTMRVHIGHDQLRTFKIDFFEAV